MKYLLVILLAAFSVGNEITKIARVNQLKKEAKEAYQAGDYGIAIEKYKYLVDSFNIAEEEVLINLSNAFYESNDTAAAVSYYQRLTRSPKRELRSQAFQQLGVVDAKRQQYEQALGSFKESLKSNPENDESRYNYELLKKLIQEQENQENQQNQENQDKENQDQNQENQEQQDQEQQDQENQEQNQEEGEQESEEQQQEQQEQEGEEESEQEQQQDPSTSEKLQEMNISEEKARMILEAMKNNEIQYIQQNKRKAKKPKKSNKPDW